MQGGGGAGRQAGPPPAPRGSGNTPVYKAFPARAGAEGGGSGRERDSNPRCSDAPGGSCWATAARGPWSCLWM